MSMSSRLGEPEETQVFCKNVILSLRFDNSFFSENTFIARPKHSAVELHLNLMSFLINPLCIEAISFAVLSMV